MVKLTIPGPSEHAPLQNLIRDYNIAFAEADLDAIVSMMAEDAVWEMVGDKTVSGFDRIKETLSTMGLEKANELVIHAIISHGNMVACNGELRYGDMAVAFCDIYTLTRGKSPKVKKLTSYGVELKK